MKNENKQDRVILDREDGLYYAIVGGRKFGGWQTKELAEGGLVVEKNRAETKSGRCNATIENPTIPGAYLCIKTVGHSGDCHNPAADREPDLVGKFTPPTEGDICNAPGPGELFCQREAGHDRDCAAICKDATLGVEVWSAPGRTTNAGDGSELKDAIVKAIADLPGVSVDDGEFAKDNFGIRIEDTANVTDIQLGAHIYGFLMAGDEFAGLETDFEQAAAETVRHSVGRSRTVWFKNVSR